MVDFAAGVQGRLHLDARKGSHVPMEAAWTSTAATSIPCWDGVAKSSTLAVLGTQC